MFHMAMHSYVDRRYNDIVMWIGDIMNNAFVSFKLKYGNQNEE